MVDQANIQAVFEGSGAAALERQVVIPAGIADGDLLLVVGNVLNQANTFSITAGPAFEQLVVGSRSGISAAVFVRRAAAADAGQTVTISQSMSLGSVAMLLVLRGGLKGVVPGTPATANQASGSTNIAVPAFTPAAGRLALHIVCVGSSTDLAALLTPPSNIDVVASSLPMQGTRRSGIAAGLSDAGETVGATWVNTSTHYAVTFLIPLAVLSELVGLINGSPNPQITATAGQVVTLTASVTGGNGNPVTYAWNWGDGTTTPASSNPVGTHTYQADADPDADTYTVTMTPDQA